MASTGAASDYSERSIYARVAAGDFGFLTLIQVFDGPANHPALNQCKLPLFVSLAVSRQRQPIVFPLPFEFYLQKISINRLYAVIPFHSLAFSAAYR
jgi:hypothetical protein